MRPIGIDLFAGAGGMSLGFEQAGFDVVAAVEKDPIHAAVHAFNFPRRAVFARDIARVSGAELRTAAGIGDGLFKLPADGLSNTLRAGTDAERGAFTSPRPIHYALPRLVTVREMARLHGFPDWFRFHVTKWHGARQIGNAVPPPLARAVAGAVMDALGLTPRRSADVLPLGDPALLAMSMEAATARFGEAVVIGRRTSKSGARKHGSRRLGNPTNPAGRR